MSVRILSAVLPWLLLATPALAGPTAELPASAEGLLPASWSQVKVDARPTTQAWWLALGGEELGYIVSEAIGSNTDSRIAKERVHQADARRAQSTAALLPTAKVSGSWLALPSTAQASTDTAFQQGTASLDVAVPLSLRSAAQNRRAFERDRDGAAADRDGTSVNAAVQSARLWLDVVYARERLATVNAQIIGDTSILTLVESRYRAGDTSAVDVLQQRQQLASSRASLPAAQVNVGRAERALTQFLGRALGSPVVVSRGALPDAPPALIPPDPDVLVVNHPKVLSAVAAYEASRARSRGATAGYLPSLSATGSLGVQVLSTTDYDVSNTWSAGVVASIPVFNGGRTQAAVRESRSSERAALNLVEQRVLDVVVDVEDALAIEAQRREEVVLSRAQTDAARAALEASRIEYHEGLSTYNAVLNALSMSKQAELSLLAARRNHLNATLDLVAMSGGLWVGDLESS